MLVLALGVGALGACGGDSDEQPPPPGSKANPLVALPNPALTRTPPAPDRINEADPRIVKRGTGRTGTPSTGTPSTASTRSEQPPRSGAKRGRAPSSPRRPCSLVTKRQAQAIIGGPIDEPLQAPQGPTCIYRAASGKQLVTLAVQTMHFSKLRKQLQNRRRVKISGRTAYCGTYGRSMLYLPLGGRRVLSVAAPCATATAFARRAAARL